MAHPGGWRAPKILDETFREPLASGVGMLEPLPTPQWTFATAAHLANRAGFGAAPATIDRLSRLDPATAVAEFVEWEKRPEVLLKFDWAKPDPDRGEKLRAYRQATGEERDRLQKERNREHRHQMIDLQAGWLELMAGSPRPLQEKLTLFWHGHFATSATKVKDPYLMWRQNDLFRRQGAGAWRPLLEAVTRDPAMLLWLDQAQSKPDHPNENFARELLELFTLGEGHYDEKDVTEAARALTGLTLDRLTQEPVFRVRLRDSGSKTFLGLTGNLGVAEVLDRIVAQPQADRFITGKLWMFFAGTVPSPALQDALAAEFRRQQQRFGPFLRTMFLSQEFYSPGVIRQQIKSPVQLLVSACLQLERPLPPALVSINTLRLLGQELFNPPNVKGWEGGIGWINTNTLLNRHNLALLLVTGENSLPVAARKPAQSAAPALQRAVHRSGDAANPESLFSPAEQKSADAFVNAIEKRLFNAPLKPRERQTLMDYLQSRGDLDHEELLGAVRLAMCLPDYQLT